MTERANYIRQVGNGSIRYQLVSTSLGGLEQSEGARQTIATSMILVFFGIFAFGFAVSKGQTNPLQGLVIFGAFVAGAYFWVKQKRTKFKSKVSEVFGRRGTASITLDSSYLLSEYAPGRMPPGSERIARSDIRRTRLMNTMDNLDTQARDSKNAATAVAAGRMGGVLMAGHAQAQAKTNKARLVCFGVVVDHGNSSAVLADGLDELSARNFYDDLSKDVSAVSLPVMPVSRAM